MEPAGVRFATSLQTWQPSINTASIFNRDLMYKIGAAQVREFKGKGIEVEKQLFKLLKE